MQASEDALGLAQRILRGQVGAREVMQATLLRAADADPRWHTVVQLNADSALRQAERVDALVASCRTASERAVLQAQHPFLGVPLLLQDGATAATDLPAQPGASLGLRRRSGQEASLRDAADSTLVARYRRAGFIPFGRSGGPTLACDADVACQGAARAVALGLVHAAHASDEAGELRLAAACCGLIGLKTSRGLVPQGPLDAENWAGLASEHLLGRSTADSAAALLATAGVDAGALQAAPGSLLGLMEALRRAAAAPRLRIGLCDTTLEGAPVHPDAARAVHGLAARLEALGHHIDPARPPFAALELARPLAHVLACSASLVFRRLQAASGPIPREALSPLAWSAIELGQRLSGVDCLEQLAQLQAFGRRMAPTFERYDLLLTPALTAPGGPDGAPARHFDDFLASRIGPDGLWRFNPYAPLANATGGASLALPAAQTASGQPMGGLLTGQLGDDALLLQLSAELEAAGGRATPATAAGAQAH
jgi:amidase